MTFLQTTKKCLTFPGFYVWMVYISLPAVSTLFTEMWSLGVLLIIMGFLIFPLQVYTSQKLNARTK